MQRALKLENVVVLVEILTHSEAYQVLPELEPHSPVQQDSTYRGRHETPLAIPNTTLQKHAGIESRVTL